MMLLAYARNGENSTMVHSNIVFYILSSLVAIDRNEIIIT